MPRLAHGSVPSIDDVTEARNALADAAADIGLAFAMASPADLHDFDFMFPTLQNNPANLLPVSAETVRQLKRLGRTMADTDELSAGRDSTIPAAYTYFGQFVDHDITLETQTTSVGTSVPQLIEATMAPQDLAQIRNQLRNLRSATLDLDNVYSAPAPADPANPAKMRIGRVSDTGSNEVPSRRPRGKGRDNDLPRRGRSNDPLRDREALIGDPRNDENTIVGQLHLAFLKAHNALIDEGRTRAQARRVLRQHYQHVVIHDYLKRIVDPAIVNKVLTDGNRWFNALAEPFFMPLEFSVAAFRFGHTMVRGAYDFNVNFNFSGKPGTFPADLGLLFTFGALSGQLGDFDTLPENWIIEWENILDGAKGAGGKARRFDTALASAGGTGLFALSSETGEPLTPPDAGRLAVRNLLRGYRLRMPTGQAVAKHLKLPVLTEAQLRATAISDDQRERLEPFVQRTPLWYYLLAEAKHHGGNRLGPVGGTIVAEVLIGLVRRSPDSILSQPSWKPSLPSASAGKFQLADLLRFAGVLGTKTGTRTYTVKPGDTLTKIAQAQLGDGDRWTEIFLLNRATIRDPDQISVGQVLILPPNAPAGPGTAPTRVYKVKQGDTLSGIAAAELGDADRWREIFTLNRSVLTNPDVIVPGTVLVLPA
ncbi:MAG TPA: LysM peptidoglycan-binding domain-containing protein [Propionibacteriaceae bacterium]|nr:LysM peptidoglycan-binding domain-containing protein [Propionibacteriaceae bacterium]